MIGLYFTVLFLSSGKCACVGRFQPRRLKILPTKPVFCPVVDVWFVDVVVEFDFVSVDFDELF